MIDTNFLKNIRLFSPLSDKELQWILERTDFQQKNSGELILTPGEPSNGVYYVINGQAGVFSKINEEREDIIVIMDAGSTFGEISSVDNQPQRHGVKAMKKSCFGFLRAEYFLELLGGNSDFSLHVLKIFSSLIRSFENKNALLSINNIQRRVAALLLSIAKPDTENGEKYITRLPTQQEIAKQVNTSRESVSRVINALMDMNLIKKDGRSIIIINPVVFEKIVNKK